MKTAKAAFLSAALFVCSFSWGETNHAKAEFSNVRVFESRGIFIAEGNIINPSSLPLVFRGTKPYDRNSKLFFFSLSTDNSAKVYISDCIVYEGLTKASDFQLKSKANLPFCLRISPLEGKTKPREFISFHLLFETEQGPITSPTIQIKLPNQVLQPTPPTGGAAER